VSAFSGGQQGSPCLENVCTATFQASAKGHFMGCKVEKCFDMSTYDKAFQIKYCTLCKSLPNDISHLEKYFKEKNDCIIYKEGTSSVS
jgi:hypothetical protein